jgi:hypothetical protein
MKRIASIAFLFALIVMFPGCSSLGGLFGTQGESGPDPQLAAQVELAKANLEELKANATADITKAVAEGDAKLEAKARETVKTVEKAQEKLAAVESTIKRDAAGNVDPAATATGAAALLPPPWNVLAMLGIPLVVGGIQEVRKRRADANAKSIVNSIDVLMQDAIVKGALKNVNPDVKASAHEQLTPAAKKLIDAESVT